MLTIVFTTLRSMFIAYLLSYTKHRGRLHNEAHRNLLLNISTVSIYTALYYTLQHYAPACCDPRASSSKHVVATCEIRGFHGDVNLI